MSTTVWAIVIAGILVLALLVPYLIQEIEKGKAQKSPGSPVGAGDARPGTRSNPAPGQPDPYSASARR